MMKITRMLPLLTALLGVTGCAVNKPMPTVEYVDIPRFMGDWYVIANIPTFVERGAFNAVETYALNEDGSIATTFRFNKDAFDGELKQYHPTGYIVDADSNALWGMQFLWPIKADYRIVFLDEDYSLTVIGREARDYAWVMARQPSISGAQYQRALGLIAELGYDLSKLQRVPQKWGGEDT